MNSKSKYIGLTVGPLIKTLQQSKSTRALFCASYLYSFAMGEFLDRLKSKKNQIILPAPDRVQGMGVGLHPDRLIMTVESPDDFSGFMKIREAVITEIHNKIMADHPSPSIDRDYLAKYFQFYCLEGDFSSLDTVNQALDTLELRIAFPNTDMDELRTFLNRKRHNFLLQDAGIPKGKFPSLIEIAARELHRINPKVFEAIINAEFTSKKEKEKSINTDIERDETLIQKFKEKYPKKQKKEDGEKDNQSFKPYHKYIAIVYADGDSMGTYSGTLSDADNKVFSTQLRDFGVKAKDIIEDYGGTPVFIGGDDLMFFAPVKYDMGKNIFSLMNELDDEFKSVGSTPTLSYGVSITYYKHPMNEALELSRNLLKDTAKKQYANRDKNALAFDLVKHSGQSIKGDWQKSDGPKSVHQMFLNLLNLTIDSGNFINSITYTLEFHRNTINHLMTLEDKNDRIKNFFDNNFNEDVHKRNLAFMENIVDLIKQLYSEYPANVEIGRQPLDKLYAMLRFIHFVTTDEQ